MAFKLVKNLTVDWPVHVEKPVSGGKVERQEFTASFKILGDDEFQEEGKKAANDLEFLDAFLVGWADLEDENGKPLAFNKKNKTEVFRYSYIRTAVFKAYAAACSGMGDPEIKN